MQVIKKIKMIFIFFILWVISITIMASDSDNVVTYKMNMERNGYINTNGIKNKPKIIYKVKIQGLFVKTPIIVDKMIYISSDSYLYAIYANDGKIKWKNYYKYGISLPPTYYNGKLIIYANNMLQVLDATTGKEVWTIELKRAAISSPVIYNNILYVGIEDYSSMDKEFDEFPLCKLYSIDINNGKILWEKNFGYGLLSSNIASDSKNLYFSITSYNFISYRFIAINKAISFNIKTKKILWETDLKLELPEPIEPTVGDKLIYFTTNDSILIAINKSNGKLIWRFEKTYPYTEDSTPSIFNNKIYVGLGEKKFYIFNSETGEILKTINLERWIYYPSCITNNSIIFVAVNSDYNPKSKIYSIDLKGENVLWEYEINDCILTMPVVSDGKIYFGAADSKNPNICYLYAMGEKE